MNLTLSTGVVSVCMSVCLCVYVCAPMEFVYESMYSHVYDGQWSPWRVPHDFFEIHIFGHLVAILRSKYAQILKFYKVGSLLGLQTS